MKRQLTSDFLSEFIKCCLRSKHILEIGREHLKFNYLPTEQHKFLWQAMVDYLDTTGSIPTIGILAQQHAKDPKILALLNEIKQVKPPDKQFILDEFEEFIRQSMFVATYDRLGDLYNDGSQEEAYELIKKTGEELAEFSIRETYYEPVFTGFDKRLGSRQIRTALGENKTLKIPFSLDQLDDITHGGMDVGDTALFCAQSGVGKTKLLRWIGVGAARRGYKVAHFQLEGSAQECYDGYDATWTGCGLYNIEYGNIKDEKILSVIDQTIKKIRSSGGEIYVEAYEQFNSATLVDIRNSLIAMEKNYGKIDLILIDYLELLEPGDGKKYMTSNEGERSRRRVIGRGLKNIAVEFESRLITATPASTVNPELLNDPNFVMTRYNVAEFKAIIEPFSYFITINQTRDEWGERIIRLYNDKIRKYKAGQIYVVCTDYNSERFYDRKRTLQEHYKQALKDDYFRSVSIEDVREHIN